MRALRTATVALLVIGLSTPAFAGDVEKSIARAAQQTETESRKTGGARTAVWVGTALFVGGMAAGLYAFMNNKNGEFAEFGEANSVNKKLGAAGVGVAFAGGVLIFLGTHRAKQMPAVTVGAGQVRLTKQISW